MNKYIPINVCRHEILLDIILQFDILTNIIPTARMYAIIIRVYTIILRGILVLLPRHQQWCI